MSIEASTSEAVADWIEASLLVSEARRFGLDRLFELAAAEIGASEATLARGLSVMSRRAALLGDIYPFVADDLAVRQRPDPRFIVEYSSLLHLTPGSVARQTVRGAETAEMGLLLENIATRALANFWGPGGQAIRFAFPSDLGRPKEFDQAVLWLAKRVGLKPGAGYRPPRRRDGGVDVVAWRSFRDRRPGFPIALAQCTIQAEVFTKTTDVDLRLWASWLALDVDPLSILVIPGTIRREGPEWAQLSTVVLPIERLRLMELLDRGSTPDNDNGWTTATESALRQVLRAGDF